jgi:CHASE2 domain-containing sensor protein
LIHDAYFSPADVSARMPGVEFHANMIDSLFRNVTLRPLNA